MSDTISRVRDALRAFGGDHTIVELTEPARTAADAARLAGCQVAQIANSLVFKAPARDAAVLVMASGGRREIWAAGGHPHTVFRLTPDELERMTGGRVFSVR